MKTTLFTKMIIINFFVLSIPIIATAQPEPLPLAKIPQHKEIYSMNSGLYDGLSGPRAQSFSAFRQVIKVPNATWLQLHFNDYNLGEQSYVTITSLEDSGKQRLDAKNLRQWQNSSAYFNGNAVEVEMHVAPGDKGIYFSIEEITVGERAQPEPLPPAKIPQHKEIYSMNSGLYDGLSGLTAQSFSAFRQVIKVSNAAWLQLHFNDYNLGEQSYVTITSLEDSSKQRFDTKTLRQWQNSSAYFNGDAVEVEMHVAPGDKDIYFSIEEITVGERAADQQPPGICGETDDRLSSNDPRVGRISKTVAGTTWIIANGALLTAGHGGITGSFIVEFNVPPSDCDGTINRSLPEHQYHIDPSRIISVYDGGIGNDWAIFACFPNVSTGLLPAQAQKSFYRISRDSDPALVRVTGYGIDDSGPPGCTGADNQTQQTDSGDYLGETIQNPSNIYIDFLVDIRPGNSGGPVIVNGTTLAIGIATHVKCPTTHNSGTSFENDNLENAIHTFPGATVVYADKYHSITLEDGTICRPFDTISEAVIAIPSGGIISIVTGSYDETLTINKAVTLAAPVGIVTIGK